MTTEQISNEEARALVREFVNTELFPNKKAPAPSTPPDLADKVIQKINDQETK